jgi:hypothetical protein
MLFPFVSDQLGTDPMTRSGREVRCYVGSCSSYGTHRPPEIEMHKKELCFQTDIGGWDGSSNWGKVESSVGV